MAVFSKLQSLQETLGIKPKLISPIPDDQIVKNQVAPVAQQKPSQILDFGVGVAQRVADFAGDIFKGGKALGQQLYNNPANYNLKLVNQDLERSRSLLQAAKAARERGDTASAIRFSQQGLQISQDAGKRADQASQQNQDLWDTSRKGIIRSGQVVLGAPYMLKNMVGSAAAAGIGALATKKQDESYGHALGRNLVDTIPINAVTRFTSPLGTKLAGSVVGGTLAKQVGGRAISGATNAVEDEIIAKLDGVKRGLGDRLLSFGMGAIVAPDQNEQLWQKLTKGLSGSEKEAAKKIIQEGNNKYRDTSTGRYTLGQAKVIPKTKPVDEFVEMPNGTLIRKGYKPTYELGSPIRMSNAFGGVAGVEYERDENGKLRVKYNPYKGAAGMGLMVLAGTLKSTRDIVEDPNFKPGSTLKGATATEKVLPPGQVEQVFKTEKFNVGKTEVKILKNLQEQLGMTTRGVRSHAEVKEIAESLGLEPAKLLQDVKQNRITDAEVAALGNVISTSSQRIAKLSRLFKKSPNDESLKAAIDQEENFLKQAIQKRIKGGTEAGRAVSAFRIIANKNLDPAYWLGKAQQQIGDNKDLKPEVVTAINKYIMDKDRLGLAKFVSKLGESTGPEKAIALWKAGLLTGLRTHEANIISNTAMGALETVKDIPATAFDIARSVLTKSERAKSFGPSSLTSSLEGAGRGLGYAGQYLKTGIDPREANKMMVTKPIRFGDTKFGKVAQKYVDTIFGSLGAEDKVFRESAFSKSLADQASVEGINKKLSAGEIQNLYKNPTESMLKQAEKDAGYATFNKDNALSDFLRGGKAATSPIVRTAVDVVAPFTRTPVNVAEAMFDYTPAGIVKQTVKKIINNQSVTDRELADAFGRSVTGAGIIWAGYQLAKAGKIVGPSPASESERSQMYLEGKQSNSVLIGGQWRGVSRISPVGNLLLIGANYYNSGGSLPETGAGAVKSLTEQTFLKGVSGGLQAINDPGRFGSSFVENTVSSSIPSFASDLARANDPLRRDPKGAMERTMNRIPGLRNELPAQINALGNTVPQEGGFWGNMIDPFNSTTPTSDSLVKEMGRVGYNLNEVGDMLNKEKLTPDQQRNYQKIAGEQIRAFLPQVINSPEYQKADIETQKSFITKVVNSAKDFAREQIKANPGILGPKQSSLVVKSAFAQEPTAKTQTTTSPSTTRDADLTKPFVITTSDGKVKTIDLSKLFALSDFVRTDLLDKKLKSTYNSEVTSKINDIVTLYKNGKISATQAEKLITALEARKIKTSKPKKRDVPRSIKMNRSFLTGKKVRLKASVASKLKTIKLSDIKPRQLKK